MNNSDADHFILCSLMNVVKDNMYNIRSLNLSNFKIILLYHFKIIIITFKIIKKEIKLA